MLLNNWKRMFSDCVQQISRFCFKLKIPESGPWITHHYLKMKWSMCYLSWGPLSYLVFLSLERVCACSRASPMQMSFVVILVGSLDNSLTWASGLLRWLLLFLGPCSSVGRGYQQEEEQQWLVLKKVKCYTGETAKSYSTHIICKVLFDLN